MDEAAPISATPDDEPPQGDARASGRRDAIGWRRAWVAPHTRCPREESLLSAMADQASIAASARDGLG